MRIQTFEEKAKSFISQIRDDKKTYFAAGFAICAIVSLLFGYIVGFVSAVAVEVGKEAHYCIAKKVTPQFTDIFCTIAGAVAFIVLSVMITLSVQAFFMGLCF